MKGFKAFKKGLKCKGFQFEENGVFEENEAIPCECGFHFCENPIDTLDYYDLVDGDCNMADFAPVEALEEALTDDNKKYCTKKIKIGASVGIKGLIKATIDFMFEKNEVITDAQLASSGNYAKLASSGDFAQLASSGNYAQLASSGNYAQLASSGDFAQLASSGDSAKLASSGDSVQLASSGNSAQLASSGNYAQLASSGDSVQLASSGDFAKLASSGDFAQLASSGNYAKLAMGGSNSIGSNIGFGGIIKGKIGCWITLAEYEFEDETSRYIPIDVKSGKIDGEILKENIWYKLEKGVFVEVNNGVSDD